MRGHYGKTVSFGAQTWPHKSTNAAPNAEL